MTSKSMALAFIGFGEAAMAFAEALRPRPETCRAYDIKTDSPATRITKLADFRRYAVDGCETAAEAIATADLILSLVTADQALAAAAEATASLPAEALFFDMNSVAPDTKRAAAALIERAGGAYVDVAIMSPVQPAPLSTPLLVSGPHAEQATEALRSLGFAHVEIVGARVGAASSIKMIRSVMIKGIEALAAECFLAAHSAGVMDAVINSLDASSPGADWRKRADYNLDRMLIHGLRRAAEMDEVVKTLQALGTGCAMARATADRQRALGTLGLTPPEGLAAKAALILDRKAEAA